MIGWKVLLRNLSHQKYFTESFFDCEISKFVILRTKIILQWFCTKTVSSTVHVEVYVSTVKYTVIPYLSIYNDTVQIIDCTVHMRNKVQPQIFKFTFYSQISQLTNNEGEITLNHHNSAKNTSFWVVLLCMMISRYKIFLVQVSRNLRKTDFKGILHQFYSMFVPERDIQQ